MKHAGTLITGLILAGVAAILLFNLEPGKPSASSKLSKKAEVKPEAGVALPGPVMGVREYPIGDEVTKNAMRIAAVWLPAVTMEGMATPAGSNPVHIEADIKATEDNPQGFAKDEKVSYLKVSYAILPTSGGSAIASGEMGPMMARDGFHYGATIALPAPGDYRLVYEIQPGSANGLGLHRDAATGVAAWWSPFEVAFDWTVEPDAATPALAGSR